MPATPMAGSGPVSNTRTEAADLRLRVTTAHCPQVMLRILNLVAQHAIIPWEINYTRRPRSLVIVIGVEGRHLPMASTLAARIGEMVMVRSVQVTERRRAQ